MSEMTTQEMIEWLHRPAWERPHYTVYTEDEVTAAIAARLKALEAAVSSAAHEAHLRGRVYAATTCNDVISADEIHEVNLLVKRAILDAAREVEK